MLEGPVGHNRLTNKKTWKKNKTSIWMKYGDKQTMLKKGSCGPTWIMSLQPFPSKKKTFVYNINTTLLSIYAPMHVSPLHCTCIFIPKNHLILCYIIFLFVQQFWFCQK